MPFIPDSVFGVCYMVAVLITASIALYRQKNLALAAVLVAHFATLRSIATINHESAALWCLHDVFLIAAASLTKTKHGFAVAACFIPVLLIDQIWLFWGSTFEANSAVAETCGYLAMIIIAGLGDDLGGYINRRSNNARASIGRLADFLDVAGRGKVFGLAGFTWNRMGQPEKASKESLQ
jgi:hypothetical protein